MWQILLSIFVLNKIFLFKMIFLLNVNLTLFPRRVSNSLSLNLGRLMTSETRSQTVIQLLPGSLGPLSLLELSHHEVRKPRLMERTMWMSSMTAQLQSQLRTSINHQTCEQMRLWMTVVSSNTSLHSLQNFLAEAWHTMEQRKTAVPFLNSWPTESVTIRKWLFVLYH